MTSEAVLETRTAGDIHGEFFIPDYQRGYRWGPDEVDRLLDDIDQRGDGPYYLQPLVVRSRGDGTWELIDGQQRLTTIFLILRYIKQEVLPTAEIRYELFYETRPGSKDYLETLDPSRRDENIDYFHIASVYDRITEWFEQHPSRKVQAGVDFYTALSKHVKVIWYEVPASVDASELFRRLNVGRIPLTDAELVKALLLSRTRDGGLATDRAQEVAAQWDRIEQDLRILEVWSFVTGSASGPSTHISLLLDTLAGGEFGRERPLYETFERLRARFDATPQGTWDEIVGLHSLVMGWFDDRNLFHKIGYLTASGENFRALVALSENRPKSEFEALLDGLIAEQLNLAEDALRDLEYEDRAARSALLLMNAETVRRAPHSSERYSFQAHAAGTWTLEHIHAQQAQDLQRAEQWRAWLELHREALEEIPEIEEMWRDELLGRIDAALQDLTGPHFRTVQAEVTKVFEPASGDDSALQSIANLALLTSGDNSALKNSVFDVKRRQIIELDRAGSYIPICTRNVFLKYYTKTSDQQLYFWGPQDRAAYLDAMVDMLGPYLKEEAA